MFSTYDTVLRRIADDLAPEHVVKSRVRPSSRWFDADCRQARHRCRRFERRYHQLRTPDNRRAWIAATKSKLDLFQSKRDAYWLERVKVDGQTNRLWRTLSDVLGVTMRSCHTAGRCRFRGVVCEESGRHSRLHCISAGAGC